MNPAESGPTEPLEPTPMFTESLYSIDVYVDEPGDTTIRPRRPEIPRFWPPDYPPPGSPELPPEYR